MDVTNAMSGLYEEHFGRRPTGVRTFWAGPDAITCFLENTFTLSEHKLIALDNHRGVRDVRSLMQYRSVASFCEPVERITGRTVQSFHNSTDTQTDGHTA